MIDWHSIMQSWDDQQTRYLPTREERFQVMFDTLDTLFEDNFTVLDLACGTGSISGRVLERFPHAKSIAIDLDPILMEIGKQTWDFPGRLQWLDVNLSHPDWSVDESKPLEWLKNQRIDAILTTTALHWLPASALVQMYLQLGKLQVEGGIIMNGDHMMFRPHMRTFRQVSEAIKAKSHQQVFEKQGGDDYATWWAKLREQLLQDDPVNYGKMLEERDKRFVSRQHDFSNPIRAVHEAAMSNAGYKEVASIWQHYDNCVLLAVRGKTLSPVKD